MGKLKAFTARAGASLAQTEPIGVFKSVSRLPYNDTACPLSFYRMRSVIPAAKIPVTPVNQAACKPATCAGRKSIIYGTRKTIPAIAAVHTL